MPRSSKRKEKKKKKQTTEEKSEKKRQGTRNELIALGFAVAVVLNNLFSNESSATKMSQESVTNVGFGSIPRFYGDIISPTKHHVASQWSCNWFPNDHVHCDELFLQRIPEPLTNQESILVNGNIQQQVDSQRWLFFGDSTMKRLFDRSALKQALVQDPFQQYQSKCLGDNICEEHLADRCELNSVFGLPYPEKWIAPDPYSFEGPKKFGLTNHFCSDCSGCQSNYLSCKYNFDPRSGTKTQCSNSKRRYGGYMTMEFARDREIQTPIFQTTQENIAHYLKHEFNSKDLVRQWGKPICVVGTGNHDVLLDGITTKDFTSNVHFLLHNLKHVCSHMVWLGNTCNGRESKFPQTMKQMKVWDSAVKEMIEAEPDLMVMMTFVEVFDASLTFSHSDFIHMSNAWYEELGKFFLNFII